MNRIKFAGLKLISAQPLRTPGGLDFTPIGVLWFPWALGRPQLQLDDGPREAKSGQSLCLKGVVNVGVRRYGDYRVVMQLPGSLRVTNHGWHMFRLDTDPANKSSW